MIFPRFVCRISALPADIADDFLSPRCSALITPLSELDQELESSRDGVSDELRQLVGTITDARTRRSVLALRRDLYNLRCPKESEVTRVFDDHVFRSCAATQQQLTRLLRRAELEARLHETFIEERARGRRHLWHVTRNATFQLGLLLASLSFYDAQGEYEAKLHATDLTGEADRIESGLLRYLLRTCLKATPFGTFSIITLGEFSGASSGESGVTLEAAVDSIRLFPRINKAIAETLCARLLERDIVREALYVSLNGARQTTPSEYIFLDSRWRGEAFRRVKRSTALDAVLGLLNRDGRVTLEEFVRDVAAQPSLRTDVDAASRFVQELLRAGVLTLSFGVAYQDPNWDIAVRRALKGVPDDVASSAADSLERLRAILRESRDVGLSAKRRMMHEASARLRNLFVQLGVRERPSLGPYRVDASSHHRVRIARNTEWNALEREVCAYVTSTLSVAWPHSAQANMRHFYDQYYRASDNAVPLLRFYEDYYREHYKAHQERLRDAIRARDVTALQTMENPFGIPVVTEALRARANILGLFRDRLRANPMAKEVPFALADLADLTRPIRPITVPRLSVGFLGSLFTDPQAGGEYRFVGRNLLYALGHGHMFSRWLHTLSGDMTQALREQNRQYDSEDAIFAEIGHDSSHNANLHPSLVAHTIAYPGSEVPKSRYRVDVSDLIVSRTANDVNALQLRLAATRVHVVPLDLGFVNFDLRPPLFRLLAEFGPPNTFQLPIPATVDSLEFPGDRISFRPRLRMERLVAARAQWTVPISTVPRRTRSESEYTYYRRINSWRQQHDLPKQAFVRFLDAFPSFPDMQADDRELNPADDGSPQSSKPAVRSRLNHRKPQFVDFESPLLSKLLQKLISESSNGHIAFFERYPDSSMLPRVDGRPRTVETILQVELTNPSAYAAT